jgi:phosphatidate cytidylyltransferase
VLVPAWCALVVLHGGILHTTTPGPYYVIVLLMLIAVADTSAYFGGRRWGKKKLAPQVSPGKTWEGVFAAFVGVGICTTFGASLLGYTEQGWLQGLLFMMFSVVTAAFSIVGDLAESMFKRHAGVKDSGNLLPGHGGVLDRIDSVTAAAPVFVLGLISLTGVQSGVSQQSPVSAVSTHYQFNIVADASSLP